VKKLIKYILLQIRYILKIQKIPDILNNIYIENTSKCNLKCRFCAYDKRDLKNVPYETMPQAIFEDFVNQSLEIGYKNIGLTPTTGDVFMDKDLFSKINYLENRTELKGYFFYSNFIPLSKDSIDKLFNLKKLKNLGISIYGHDEQTFIEFSKGSHNAFLKLKENLRYLRDKVLSKKLNFKIEFSHRTIKNFNIFKSNGELSLLIRDFLDQENITYDKNSEFNNWGGIIKDTDVEGLDIKLNHGKTKKVGSCSLIYSRLIIGPNGTVNACACRDANFTLKIGNAKENKLKDIINLKNDKYKKIIERQEKNDFPDVCKSCDFYRSIYQENYPVWSMRGEKVNNYSLKDVLQKLDTR